MQTGNDEYILVLSHCFKFDLCDTESLIIFVLSKRFQEKIVREPTSACCVFFNFVTVFHREAVRTYLTLVTNNLCWSYSMVSDCVTYFLADIGNLREMSRSDINPKANIRKRLLDTF